MSYVEDQEDTAPDDWPRKPDGTPMSPGAAAAYLRGQGKEPPASMGGGGRKKSDGPDANYVEVKERIQAFYATYPTGGLVTTKVKIWPYHEFEDGKSRVMVKAKAYRTPDDPHPGRGTSWMVIPGRTPYTNGSEVENSETSAWGRAIASVGILVDRGIASAQEIRNARGLDSEPGDESQSGADALAAAAREAAGATERPDTPAGGTEAHSEPEQVSPVTGEASPVIAAAQAAADAGGGPAEVMKAAMAAQTPEIVRDEDGMAVKPKRSAAKSKAPTPDPEAQAAPPPEGAPTEGMTYDEFISAIREKFIPNGQVQQVARELVEQQVLPPIGSVRDLTDQQRLKLFYAAVIRKDDAPDAKP